MRKNASYVITPDSFAVHPDLVGVPLARPARRLAAMLLDLLIVAILVQAGGGVLFGLAAAYVFFRFARRGADRQKVGVVGRMARVSLRTVGALILFGVAISVWTRGTDALGALFRRSAVPEAGGRWAALGVAPAVIALESADTEDEARAAAPAVVNGLRASGMAEGDVREAMTELAMETERPWMESVVVSALAPPDTPRAAVDADAAALAYAAAVEAGDSVAMDSLRPALGSVLAADSIADLRRVMTTLREERSELRTALDEERNAGFMARLFGILDELGLEFGWTGLYFTAFVAMWKGQTPAKRLLGVRVVRLNGQPMTLWMSFERFGGYAAGLVTGLLGFAQVYWDRNRQMIHDKIVETVVVREAPGNPVPAAAAAPIRGDGVRG